MSVIMRLQARLIWPTGILFLCFSAGEITALFQLQPNTESRISIAFKDPQSNPLLSIRKGHQHINRKVCCSNLQFLWVLQVLKEKQLTPGPPTPADKLQNRGSGCVKGEPLPGLWGVHRMGSAAGKMTASSCAGGLSHPGFWRTVGSDIRARASVARKQHRSTLLGHGITETHLVAEKTYLKRNRNRSQIQFCSIMNYRENQKQDQNQRRQQQQNEVRMKGKSQVSFLLMEGLVQLVLSTLLIKKEGFLNNSGSRRTI